MHEDMKELLHMTEMFERYRELEQLSKLMRKYQTITLERGLMSNLFVTYPRTISLSLKAPLKFSEQVINYDNNTETYLLSCGKKKIGHMIVVL